MEHDFLVLQSEDENYRIGTNLSVNNNGLKKSVVDLIIPNFWNSKPITVIGMYAFRYNSEIRSIYVPSNIITIRFDGIAHNDNLVSLVFAKNSSLKTVGRGFLYRCHMLKKVILPNSLNSVGRYSFGNSSFSHIYYCGFNELNETLIFETGTDIVTYPQMFHVPFNYAFTSIGKFSNLKRDYYCEKYINGFCHSKAFRRCSYTRLSLLSTVFLIY